MCVLFKRQVELMLFLLLSFAVTAACDSGEGEETDASLDGGDGDADADADETDADEPDADEPDADQEGDSLPEPWSAVSFTAVGEGDALADCEDADSSCYEADIDRLRYGVHDGALYFDLRFAGPFMEIDREIGSFEIFVFSPDAGDLGRSIRSVGGSMTFWEADCSSHQKHNGCHWYFSRELPTFEMDWVEPGRLLCRVSLEQWDFDESRELFVGVAAAPFLIQQSAEFTDRFPDELTVTSTDVTGLLLITIDEEG